MRELVLEVASGLREWADNDPFGTYRSKGGQRGYVFPPSLQLGIQLYVLNEVVDWIEINVSPAHADALRKRTNALEDSAKRAEAMIGDDDPEPYALAAAAALADYLTLWAARLPTTQDCAAQADVSGDGDNRKPNLIENKKAKALVALMTHPEWPDGAIAHAVGCHPKSLYRWPEFKLARAHIRARRNAMPRGSKDAKTGDVEAWDDGD